MSADETRREDAAPDQNADQGREDEAVVGDPQPPIVYAMQPWTEARYTRWAIAEYSPLIETAEQVQDLHTTTVIKGRFEGTMYLVDSSVRGQAFMKTEIGPVEFTRGPVSWNATSPVAMIKLCQHVSRNQHMDPRIGYRYRHGVVWYSALAKGIIHQVTWEHPWHPDHGQYLRETYGHILRRGGQAPFTDAIPTEQQEFEGIEPPEASYIELQSFLSASRSFQGVRPRRTRPRRYSVNLRISGTIEPENEQDFSEAESLATQSGADAGSEEQEEGPSH